MESFGQASAHPASPPESHPRGPTLRPPSPPAPAAPGAHLPHVSSSITHPAGSEPPGSHAAVFRGETPKPAEARKTKATQRVRQAAENTFSSPFSFDLLLHALCPRQRQVSQASLPSLWKVGRREAGTAWLLFQIGSQRRRRWLAGAPEEPRQSGEGGGPWEPEGLPPRGLESFQDFNDWKQLETASPAPGVKDAFYSYLTAPARLKA